jgi:peptidoglycan hydrolase-like protein with peptidoglycan-binding domain
LTLDGLFSGTAYAYYNDYSKKGILAKAQEKLKNAGLYAGQVDGDTGPKTQAAINSWQQSQGLPLSGRLDAETQASLGMGHMDEMSPPARTQRTAPPSQRTWQAPAPKRQPQKTPPPSFQEGIQNLRNGIQLIREIQGILPRR